MSLLDWQRLVEIWQTRERLQNLSLECYYPKPQQGPQILGRVSRHWKKPEEVNHLQAISAILRTLLVVDIETCDSEIIPDSLSFTSRNTANIVIADYDSMSS